MIDEHLHVIPGSCQLTVLNLKTCSRCSSTVAMENEAVAMVTYSVTMTLAIPT